MYIKIKDDVFGDGLKKHHLFLLAFYKNIKITHEIELHTFHKVKLTFRKRNVHTCFFDDKLSMNVNVREVKNSD